VPILRSEFLWGEAKKQKPSTAMVRYAIKHKLVQLGAGALAPVASIV